MIPDQQQKKNINSIRKTKYQNTPLLECRVHREFQHSRSKLKAQLLESHRLDDYRKHTEKKLTKCLQILKACVIIHNS